MSTLRAKLWRHGLSAALALSIGALVGLPATDNSPHSTFLEREVLTPEVAAGGVLQVRYLIDRRKSCESTNNSAVLDAANIIHNYAPNTQRGPVVVEERTAVRTVPQGAAIGPAKYRMYGSYVCNWWQRMFGPILVFYPDLPFTIVAAAP